MTHVADVPSPIDLQQEADARAWAGNAQAARPWRIDFFEGMCQALRQGSGVTRVLELGSGPGFLAEHVLSQRPDVHMVLLDFSAPMHQLAQERLQPFLGRITCVERSFKSAGWSLGLGKFDHVVTNQAVHELRHKRHATALHAEVRTVLAPRGSYLVSDHHAGPGGMSNTELYMTVEEQRAALQEAGFADVRERLRLKGMVLHHAAATDS